MNDRVMVCDCTDSEPHVHLSEIRAVVAAVSVQHVHIVGQPSDEDWWLGAEPVDKSKPDTFAEISVSYGNPAGGGVALIVGTTWRGRVHRMYVPVSRLMVREVVP